MARDTSRPSETTQRSAQRCRLASPLTSALITLLPCGPAAKAAHDGLLISAATRLCAPALREHCSRFAQGTELLGVVVSSLGSNVFGCAAGISQDEG